jgi:Protein of unknown function (DUF1592)/Protein of unknown function (DUF1588)/Protein of unknown function (DUF1595)/Protein of unknown function (DUF1585)
MTRLSRAIVILALVQQLGCSGTIASPYGPEGQAGVVGTRSNTPGGSFDNIDPVRSDVTEIVASLQCTKEPVGVSAPIRTLTPVQYANSVRELFGGQVTASTGYPKASGVSVTGYSTDVKLNALSAGFAEGVANAADEAALQVMGKLTQILSCASAANKACAEQFVDTYATRAFRRPLIAEERSALLAQYDAAMAEHSNFGAAIAELSSTILQHPQFIYLPEIGKLERGQRTLDDYELGSRLSFLLWDAPPDAELLRAAKAGELSAAAGLQKQAERLIKDAKFETVVKRFVNEWLKLKAVSAGSKDATLFPELNENLARAMNEELSRFVIAALRKGKGGFQALVSGRETFVNAPLAALYDADAPGASDSNWVPVTLGADRSGLLTRAAVLAGFSGPTEPSHVHRGEFVLKGLLCGQVGAPPANAQASQPMYPANSTRRERSAILQKTSPCGGCHTQIDPIGLAFDDYDALGKKLGGDVDVSGRISLTGDMEGEFTGSTELASMLSDSEQVQQCVGRQWFRYAFGRNEASADACTYATVATDLGKTEGDLASMFASVALSDGFRYRITTGD